MKAARRGGVSAASLGAGQHFLGVTSPSLGTNREIVGRSSRENPVQKRVYRFAARVERYELMAVAGELLPGEYVRYCMHSPAPSGARLVYSPARKSAHIAGIKRCGSVWMCPNCSTLISERRRVEIAAAIAYVERNGGQIVLATHTLSHALTNSLRASLDALNGAYRTMQQRRDFKALRMSYGLIRSIKAVEVNHGKNGFHPHQHTLYAVNAGIDIAALQRDLAAAWLPSVRRFGFSASAAHGVDVRGTFADVEKYVSKLARTWTAADELAKANTKTGRKESLTPADLLRSYRDTGNLAHAALFREYALTMKGTHQNRWSPGFKRLVGVDDRTDVDLAENWLDDDKWTYTLAALSLTDWTAVRWCGPSACAELERAGDQCDRELVAEVVQRCRARYFAEGWGL